jgi:hypothetical protein
MTQTDAKITELAVRLTVLERERAEIVLPSPLCLESDMDISSEGIIMEEQASAAIPPGEIAKLLFANQQESEVFLRHYEDVRFKITRSDTLRPATDRPSRQSPDIFFHCCTRNHWRPDLGQILRTRGPACGARPRIPESRQCLGRQSPRSRIRRDTPAGGGTAFGVRRSILPLSIPAS